LIVQQLQFDPDLVLEARVEPADDFTLALLWLAGDLVSSGFFRFGRFTSRGYGVVRLQPSSYLWQSLDTLLSASSPELQMIDEKLCGKEIAQMALGCNPLEVVDEQINAWSTM
jgi:hypothetical protein